MKFYQMSNYGENTMPSCFPGILAPLAACHKDAGATRKRLATQTMKSAVRNRIVLAMKRALRSQEEAPPGRLEARNSRLLDQLSQEAVPGVGKREGGLASGRVPDGWLSDWSSWRSLSPSPSLATTHIPVPPLEPPST